MSYIRQSQDGTYVEIPGGSNYYIYGNGEDISGWSHAEFAALIGSTVYELGLSEVIERDVREDFAEHFGGWDATYSGGITPPERAEIFCQCVDRRIDGLTLTEEIQSAAWEYADSFEVFRECEYCGEEFRPMIYDEETSYVCNDDDCRDRKRADSYEVDLSVIERDDRIYHHLHYDYGWELGEASDESMDYLFEQSPRDFDEEAKDLQKEMNDG